METNYHESAKLVTQELVNLFLANCRDRGLAPSTIGHYSGHLKHFVLAFPDGLPWEWSDLERFLTRIVKKKDARPAFRKALQALYSYLEQQNYGKSPIPPGRVGRPPKVRTNLDESTKLGRGGQANLSGLSSTSISTRQAVEDLLNSKKDLSPHTIRWYTGHFFPFMEEFPELPMKPEPIEKHIFAMQTSPEHRHGRYRALKVLYRFLERRHRLPVDPRYGVINPIREIKAPKVPRKLPASLDMTELQALINACQTPQEQALIALLADCGVRAGEIMSLTREKIGEDFIWVTGKTGERQVSISPELRDILLSLVPTGLVFLNPFSGKPFTSKTLWSQVAGLLNRAGIKKRHIGPHLLRHTFGRQSIAAGADLVTVQKQMGHTTIQTTRIYTELSSADVHKRHQETSPLKQLTLNFNHTYIHKGQKDE